MSISALNPKRLASGAEAAMNSKAAKALDWVLGIAFAVYVAWRLHDEWPAPSGVTMALVPVAVIGIFLAAWDWKSRWKAFVHGRIRARAVRKR